MKEHVTIFGVLCADDGEADYQEFLDATLKMRHAPQVIDLWMALQMTLHKFNVVHGKLDGLNDKTNRLHQKTDNLHVRIHPKLDALHEKADRLHEKTDHLHEKTDALHRLKS